MLRKGKFLSFPDFFREFVDEPHQFLCFFPTVTLWPPPPETGKSIVPSRGLQLLYRPWQPAQIFGYNPR